MTAFFRICVLMTIRRERALEERIIHDVALAALASHQPITTMYVARSEFRSDGGCALALFRFYQHWPLCSEESHTEFLFSLWSSNTSAHKNAVGSALNIC
jgi:hypothetical protein